MTKSILFLFILITTQACTSIYGKYCYKGNDMGECINFTKNGEFQYSHTIDTGSSKGVGKYTVDNNQLTLNFHPPEIENRSQVEIIKNESDLIKIQCTDFGGRVMYGAAVKNENTFVTNSLQMNGTIMKVSNMMFPVTFTVSALGYQTTIFTLNEASGYAINIILDDNRGFTIMEGQGKYKVISKKKKQLVLEPVADSSDEKIENRRLYKIAE